MLSIFVIYGWSGSNGSKKNASKTNLLMQAILKERETQPSGPVLIMGDLNADPENIATTKEMLVNGLWVDVGAHAARWNGINKEYTCVTARSKAPTRRDYIFCNQEMMPLIRNFKVIHENGLPTHSTLAIKVDVGELVHHKRLLQTPLSLYNLLRGGIQQDLDEGKPLSKDQYEIWTSIKAKFHAKLDAAMDAHLPIFTTLGATQQTDRFWKLWCRLYENAAMDTADVADTDRATFSGHGLVNIKKTTIKGGPGMKEGENCLFANTENAALKNLRKQATRCRQWADRIAIQCHGKMTMQQEVTFTELNKRAELAIRADLNLQDEQDLHLGRLLDKGDHNVIFGYSLRHHADLLDKTIEKLRRTGKTTTKKSRIEAQRCCKSMSTAFKNIRSNNTGPMLHTTETIERDGMKFKRFYCKPADIDRVVRSAWKSIRDGKIHQADDITQRFLNKYSQHLYRAEEYNIGPLSTERLFEELTQTSKSVGGMDGFTPDDLSLVSFKATRMLAVLLNLIEEGAPWPSDMIQAKGVFLAKDLKDQDDPLKFRTLLILPMLYRRWAKTRLHDLKPWIGGWRCSEMFAGVGNEGAEDAWYLTALQLEKAALTDTPITGGTADIFKCFDRVLRNMLFLLLRMGGFPTRVLNAYRGFIDNLTIYNLVGGSLGEGHKHPCGIPQGCPLSMCLIAFSLRPWIQVMRSIGAHSRILADDILILAEGPSHESLFLKAYNATFRFLQDSGAEPAPSKSTVFSTVRTTRAKLRTHVWEPIGSTVLFVLHARDLGSHICTATRMVSPTLTARLRAAVDIVRRISRTSFSREMKAHLIRMAGLAKGLYGIESSQCCETDMQILRGAIANAIGPKSRARSIDLTFATANLGKDLDPMVEMVIRRGKMLRRMAIKHPEVQCLLAEIWHWYQQDGHPGTLVGTADLAAKTPIPIFGKSGRAKWKPKSLPRGPVGLLLVSLHQVGASLDASMVVHHHNEPCLSILDVPWQHLGPLLSDMCTRARYSSTTAARTVLKGALELDSELYNQAINKLTPDDARWLSSVSNLSRTTGHKRADFIEAENGQCWLCDAPCGDLCHMLWECPKLSEFRVVKGNNIGDLAKFSLPPSLKIGLPPSLPAELCHTFWASEPAQEFAIPEWARMPDRWIPNNRATSMLQVCRHERVGLNARQLIAKKKAFISSLCFDGNSEMLDATPCSETAPEEANLFCDGSLKNQRTQFWSLGGFGVWWPSRDLAEHPLTANEQSFSHHKVPSDGSVSLFGCLKGQRASSTRSEIMAGIIGAAGPGAIHQATDSMSYCKKVNKLLDGTCLTNRKPWGLQKDGDLWQVLDKLVRQKGAHALKVSWTKGHATQQDIDKGRSSVFHRAGNDRADACADDGVAMHEEGLLQLSGQYEVKHQAYLSLVCDIHTIILNVLKAEHKLRAERDSEVSVFRKVILGTDKDQARVDSCFSGRCFLEGDGIQLDTLAAELRVSAAALRATIMSDHAGATGASGSKHRVTPEATRYHDLYAKMTMWMFLKNTRWKATAEGTNGSSWIELMIVFHIMGGNCEPKPRDPDSLCPLTSFRQQFLFFVRCFKQAVNLYTNTADKILFRPAKTSGYRLSKYGVDQHVTCISAEICLMEPIKAKLHMALATLVCNLSAAKQRDLLKGQLCVNKRRLTMKGPPPWASLVEASGVLGSCVEQLMDTASHVDVTTITSFQPGSFCIKCHICGYSVEAKNKNLIKNGQWGSVFCSSCKVGRKASKWLCACGDPWHTCAEHRIQGMACKFVQHKRLALQPTAFRSKFRKIPLGVPDELRTKMRKRSRTDLNSAESTSRRRLRWKQPDPLRGVLIGEGASLNGSSRPEAGAGVPGNETKEGHILADPTRKRVYPQRGSTKRQKLSSSSEGRIGRGSLIAQVVARNPNLAIKFPHLHVRPPDNSAQPLSTST